MVPPRNNHTHSILHNICCANRLITNSLLASPLLNSPCPQGETQETGIESHRAPPM